MKPHVLVIEPMLPEVETRLDAAYCVHRLFAAHDRAALIDAIGTSVRAIVTGGAHGASNEIVDALPRLEIIVINGIGTDAVDLERARALGSGYDDPRCADRGCRRLGAGAYVGDVETDLRCRRLCAGGKLAA